MDENQGKNETTTTTPDPAPPKPRKGPRVKISRTAPVIKPVVRKALRKPKEPGGVPATVAKGPTPEPEKLNGVSKPSIAQQLTPVVDELFEIGMFLREDVVGMIRPDRLVSILRMALDSIHSRAADLLTRRTAEEVGEKAAKDPVLMDHIGFLNRTTRIENLPKY